MKKKKLTQKRKWMVGIAVQMGVWTVIFLTVISLLVQNTATLRSRMDETAHTYVADVSANLAHDISSQMSMYLITLEQLAESIPRLTDALLGDFLYRKADIVGFDQLFLVQKDGSTFPKNTGFTNLAESAGIQASLSGKSTVVHLQGQNLLFSVPVYVDGVPERVLAGVQNQQKIQNAIQAENFDGQGLACIVDSHGKVVISPTDVQPFMRLSDIFMEKHNEDILQMERDLQEMHAGVFHFTSVDDSHLILSYHALKVNDWSLLTLVPANLIMGGINRYSLHTFLIVGGILLVFLLLFGIMIRFYRKNRKELERIAFQDDLTGGMNNTAFQIVCKEYISAAPAGSYAVVLLNVKGFKLINENYGIRAGNDTLSYIYRRLKKNLKEQELVARGEADNFFICLREQKPEEIQRRLDQMIQDINHFSSSVDYQYHLIIRQGACLVDDPGLEVTILQDRARFACQNMQEEGKCCFYSAEMIAELKKEQELLSLVEKSLKTYDFQVFFQPKIRLKDGRVGGAEALVRWKHPERGMIFPSDFIPVFEKSGHICKLDLYVFEEVCAWMDRRRKEGEQLYPVSVNLSRMHFRDQGFLQDFLIIKQKYGIPDGLLELELTESIFFDERQRKFTKDVIGQMHRYGFLVSLDDFGVGFSSLALLKEFDVDTIKLDRQFFGDMSNSKTQNIIASFIGLARKLHIGVVAEGIETEEQLEYLRRMHCDMVQGYVYAKPLPMLEYERWCAELEEK